VGDILRVNSDGLRALASQCDAAAAGVSTIAPTGGGHPFQATASAVAAGHGAVSSIGAALAARATSFGYKLRTADGVYRTADADSGQNLGAVARSIEV
jgi:hypothetical protein